MRLTPNQTRTARGRSFSFDSLWKVGAHVSPGGTENTVINAVSIGSLMQRWSCYQTFGSLARANSFGHFLKSPFHCVTRVDLIKPSTNSLSYRCDILDVILSISITSFPLLRLQQRKRSNRNKWESFLLLQCDECGFFLFSNLLINQRLDYFLASEFIKKLSPFTYRL